MSLFKNRSEATTIAELKKEWGNCKQCPFYAQRKGIVLGTGVPGKVKLYVVGQAPAGEEDKIGIPFMGPGGLLCKDLFQKLGIQSEEIAWSNVLCCKTFKDAKIRWDWIENCWDRVEAELRIFKPKGIVALGRPAAERFVTNLPKKGEVRGIRFKYQGIPGVTVIHPAILLRTKGRDKSIRQAEVDQDLDKVKELYEKFCKDK